MIGRFYNTFETRPVPTRIGIRFLAVKSYETLEDAQAAVTRRFFSHESWKPFAHKPISSQMMFTFPINRRSLNLSVRPVTRAQFQLDTNAAMQNSSSIEHLIVIDADYFLEGEESSRYVGEGMVKTFVSDAFNTVTTQAIPFVEEGLLP